MIRLQHGVAAGGFGPVPRQSAAGSRKTKNRRSEGICLRFLLCAPVGIRTPNLLIRSQMLYPLSYRRPSRGLHENSGPPR